MRWCAFCSQSTRNPCLHPQAEARTFMPSLISLAVDEEWDA
jgi:hypothetical protein